MVIVTAIAALGVGVHLLREATQSTHYRTSADSRLRVVVESRRNGAEPSLTLAELTGTHLAMCRLRVASDLEGGLEPVPRHPGRFEVVLSPALDSTDRKEFQGCIEDWNVDRNLVRVISMEEYRVP
jgi:hypothetical protein